MSRDLLFQAYKNNIQFFILSTAHSLRLQVHKNENFFGFEFSTISLLVMLKY
jgi:hypothetical protein